jgi:hypothetical protein
VAAPAVIAPKPAPSVDAPAPVEAQDDARPPRIETVYVPPRHHHARAPTVTMHWPVFVRAERTVPARAHRIVATRRIDESSRPHYPFDPRQRWASRELP